MLRIVFSLLCLFSILYNFGDVQAQPITAKAWVVSESDGTIVRKSFSADVPTPIASISKLLTVMVVLDAHQDLDELIPLSTKIRDNLPSQLTRRKLIELALVPSNNRAAQTLCEQYPGGLGVCVYAMNQKLIMMGMKDSIVYEPTGLDKRNVSTATQLVELVKNAATYPLIVEIDKMPTIEVALKKKKLIFHSTNPLVGKEPFEITKTGWIRASGGCIVTLYHDRIFIVLGSKNTHTRIYEVSYLYEITKGKTM